MTIKHVAVSMLTLAAACAPFTGRGDVRTTLSDTWRVQPAKNSETPPDEKDWGTTRQADWRWGGVENKGKTVEKIPRKDVNSLWYEQSFIIPADAAGKKLMIDFARIEGDAIVYLNGKKIGELLRPGGVIEVTPHATPGAENALRVFLTRDYTDISRQFEQDPLRFISRTHEFGAIPMERWSMGITAPVSLVALPRPVALADVFVVTSWRERKITLRLDLDATAAVEGLAATAEIVDAKGAPVLSFNAKLGPVAAGCSTVELSSPWKEPVTWELDGGYLYTVNASISMGEKKVDERAGVQFGFRELWTEGNKLMMNGHPIRLRQTLNLFPTATSISYARLIGYNAMYIQANPSLWWRDWSETPLLNEEQIAEMDRSGFATFVPVPGVAFIREKLLADDKLRADYEREMEWYIRKYRNHPCVLAWTVSMNSYNPRDAISPQGMGRRYGPPRTESGMPKVILTSCGIVNKFDPTRLAYGHADGNLGGLASANMYLNFAPLQEREEWPMLWAESGDMPYHMAEYGQPYTANFWKGKRFLPTEYTAIYFGDKAYAAETEVGMSHLIDNGLTNTSGHGSNPNWDEYPSYWDFQRLFTLHTNRSYRMWGVNGGWAYWNLNVQYGHPPGVDPEKNKNWVFSQYGAIKEPVTQKPSWANPNFDIHRQGNLPVCVYVAGSPRHTDKTHAYFAGERVEKNVAVVWDGPGAAKFDIAWRVVGDDKTVAASGSLVCEAKAGDATLLPFSFEVPKVECKSTFKLVLDVRQDGKEVEGDNFALQVFPKLKPLSLKGKVAVLDPAGKTSAWLRTLGVEAAAWKQGDSLAGIGMLVVGREALKPGETVPYKPEDIAAGLRVVIVEQMPEVWRALGFRTSDAMPRYLHMVEKNSPILQGVAGEDVVNWRGTPDLLPEGKNQPSDTQHAPKWTNTHAVASVTLQMPRDVGFSPVLACEFDMDYTPLLRWRHGKGEVWFCTLDLSGRVGADPAATMLAANLLTSIDGTLMDATRTIVYSGADEGRALLEKLGAKPAAETRLGDPKGTLLVVGDKFDGSLNAAARDEFVTKGGRVLLLPRSAAGLAEFGFKTERKTMAKAAPIAADPLLGSIGPNLLRWRTALELDVFAANGQPEGTSVLADGVIAVRKMGEGAVVAVQVGPDILGATFKDDKEKATAVEPAPVRLEQLVARLVTALGGSSSDDVATRLAFLDMESKQELLSGWNAMGPFFVDKEDGELMLSTKFPGEESAVAGDANPNYTYKRDDGVALAWRPIVRADEKGFVNLGAVMNRQSLAVAYVAKTVESDADQEAVLHLGCDWRMRAWVNGEEVFKTLSGGNRPNAQQVKIKLKKGANTISLKVASGSKGFGFYASLSRQADISQQKTDNEVRKVSLYAGRESASEFDPYEYHYW